MKIEHEIIMEEKYEELSERLEELVLDVFISVLVKLNERGKVFFREDKDMDIPF